jgi:hypothetical protein
MPETRIDAGDYTDMSNAVKDYSVDSVQLDAAGDQDETTWINDRWTQQLGYYKQIPELAAAIDAKATWTVGKGIITNELVMIHLNGIRGWGTDTFNTILENCIRNYHIGGDSFCEIVRDDDMIINLKPLDPGAVTIVTDRKGVIKRYELNSKVQGTKPKRFKPEDIFHLSRNRIGDEIHGVSIVDKLEEIILMRNEAMADYRKLLHRNVAPRIVWSVETDDAGEIAAFKAKADKMVANTENLIIPKGTAEHELLAVPTNATLNPLPWIEALNQYFFQATGVPDIILGSSKAFTEASAKIAYLAFQQTIEEEQLFIEEQVSAQLNLIIELEFPASLENELLSDKAKDGPMQAAQPNDTMAETEGRT